MILDIDFSPVFSYSCLLIFLLGIWCLIFLSIAFYEMLLDIVLHLMVLPLCCNCIAIPIWLMLCIIRFSFSAPLDFIDYTAYMDYMDLQLLSVVPRKAVKLTHSLDFIGKWFLITFCELDVNKNHDQFEPKVLSKAKCKPLVVVRFIDDIIFIWTHSKDELTEFINLFNSHEESIKRDWY